MFIHLLLGPLILFFGLIFKANPPEDMNSLYGYRTPRSMKSQKAWDLANEYSARLLVWISILTIIFQVIFSLFLEAFIAV